MAILEVLLIRKFFGRVRSNGTLQEFVVRDKVQCSLCKGGSFIWFELDE